jgi:hypothetical protein
MSLISAIAGEIAVPTRFGSVGVSNNALTLQGSPIEPRIEGNSGLMITPADVYQAGDTDFVVVTDVGGTLCPAQFRVAAVTKTGVKVTKPFGNCSEAIEVKVSGGTLIMKQRSKTKPEGADTYVYDLTIGLMTENGKSLK